MALGFMRRHRRWLYAFLWIVILGFIVFYIPAFQDEGQGQGETLARVGGLTITVGEFQRAYLRQRQVYERLQQGRLDAAALKQLGLEDRVFEGLVVERIVALEARRLGLAVDDETLARDIASSPALQDNGRFVGSAEYRRRLEIQGISAEEFEALARARLLREKLLAAVTDGVSVSSAEAEREYRRRNEQIKAEYVRVDTARLLSQHGAEADEVRARFESRKQAYRIPERRVVSYALVDAEALRAKAVVTDRDLDTYYQDHREEFSEPEQVCASHVLVKVKAAADAKEGHGDAEAKKLAAALLEKAKAGADFAALARKFSEDKGSAERGGELGCFTRGRMLPEFENAAFSLGPGELSELVKTTYGYHLIRLASRREEAVLPLAQVKDRIRIQLLQQKVRGMAEEKISALSDALQRGRSLEQAARAQGLSLEKSAPLARGETTEPLAAPALVARAFELKPGESDKQGFPVPRGYAFIALDEVQQPRLPELKEVEARVKADLIQEKAEQAARSQAGELKLRAERVGLDKAAVAMGLLRKETPGLVGRGQPLGDLGAGVALDELAYALPEKTLSEPVRVAGGFAVLRVLERKPFDALAFEKERAQLVASLRRERRDQLFAAYLGQARQRFAIERKLDAYRRLLG